MMFASSQVSLDHGLSKPIHGGCEVEEGRSTEIAKYPREARQAGKTEKPFKLVRLWLPR